MEGDTGGRGLCRRREERVAGRLLERWWVGGWVGGWFLSSSYLHSSIQTPGLQ